MEILHLDRGWSFESTGLLDLLIQRVDQVLLAKLIESTSMASTSLVSLVQLLDKVKNMVISDKIQREVREHTARDLARNYLTGYLVFQRWSFPWLPFKRYVLCINQMVVFVRGVISWTICWRACHSRFVCHKSLQR